MAEIVVPQGTETPVSGETQTAETDWKAEARKWESRAKESLATAKANEGAAKRLAEIEEAQKSEAQKAQEALAKAQDELNAERVARVRAEVAASKGIPAELLSGSTQEDLEKSAEALLAFKGEQAVESSPFPKADPSQGVRNSGGSGSTADAFAAAVKDLI